MRVLFYLGHPAHFHLFKNTISRLQKDMQVDILIKKKDILEELLNNAGFEYINLLPEGRKDSKLAIAWGLLKRDVKMFFHCLANRPDIMIGTSAEIAHVGKVLNIPSIVVNEDDADQVPLFTKLTYPFATKVLAPYSCDVGKWEDKAVRYQGYQELAYLHPNHFTPDIKRIESYIDMSRPFFILRFAQLTAHHDEGKSGISTDVASKIINLLKPHGNIYITSERELEKEFEIYRIKIDPLDIHHALFYSTMYIGDSQTMAAEAAVLGTPSIRFNDFVGKLGYLEELEDKYQLTRGIKTSEVDKLFDTIDEFLNMENIEKVWLDRKNSMLGECIDLNTFLIELINHEYEEC